MQDSIANTQIVSRAPSGRRRLWGFRGIAMVSGCLLAWLCSEVILWIFMPVPNPFGIAINRQLYFQQKYSQGRSIFHTDPEIMPGTKAPSYFTINEFGFRSPRLERIAKASGDVRIFCLGGSTTECLYLDDHDAWPEVLQRQLAEVATGRELDVVNCGSSGETTRNHLSLLVHKVVPFRPDAVIVLTGRNDFMLQWSPDYDILRREARSQLRVSYPGSEQFANQLRIAIYNVSQIARRLELFARSRRKYDEHGNPFQDPNGKWLHDVQVRAASLPLGKLPEQISTEEFEQNLRSLIGVCQAHDILPILATQPTLVSDRMTEQEIWRAALSCNDRRIRESDYLEQLERFNDVTRRLARDTNSLLVDLAADISGHSDYFYDECHFNIAGAARVASIIAGVIQEDSRAAQLLRP